jgi:hypothetical protein
MIKIVSHSSLKQFLDQGMEKFEDLHSIKDTIFVSDFISVCRNDLHSGLSEGAELRLLYPFHRLVIFSFLPPEELVQHDKFNLLALEGTTLIRLPASISEIRSAIEKFGNAPLAIPGEEMKQFCITAGITLLKNKIRKLEHGNLYGNEFAFRNRVVSPLKVQCEQTISGLITVSAVKAQLQRVDQYLKNQEIVSLIQLVKSIGPNWDNFFVNIHEFVIILDKLTACAKQEMIEPADLLILVKNLDIAFSRIAKR